MERRSSTFNPCFQFCSLVFMNTYGNVVYSFEVSLFFRKLFLKSVIFSDCQEWKGIRFSLATIPTAGNCNLFKYTKTKNTIIFIWRTSSNQIEIHVLMTLFTFPWNSISVRFPSVFIGESVSYCTKKSISFGLKNEIESNVKKI